MLTRDTRSTKSFVGLSRKEEERRGLDQFEAFVPLETMDSVVKLSEKDLFYSFQMNQGGLNFRRYFYLNSVTEWRRKYIHYEKLQRYLVEMYAKLQNEGSVDEEAPANSGPVDAQVESVLISFRVFDSNLGKQAADFLTLLSSELDKVEVFYVEQREYFLHRFELMTLQMQRSAATSRFINVDASPTIADPTATMTTMQSYVQELREKRQMTLALKSFRASISEFIRGIDMLQSFCSLNKLAAVQLVGRYEKIASEVGDEVLRSISNEIQELIEQMSFSQAGHEMTQMQQDIERTFHDTFYPDRDKDTNFAPVKLKQKYQRALFTIGSCLGLILAGVILIIFLLATTDHVLGLPAWQSTYYIFRGLFLVNLMLWYIGVNMYGWRKSLINFRFIAEIDQYRISHQKLHMFASLLSVYLVIMFVLYLVVARGIVYSHMPVRFFGFIQFVSCLLVLLCPFNIFMRRTRWWLLCKSARVVAAPFFQVRFIDFFLADQFTSLVLVLYDVFFACCYCVSDVWTGQSVCATIIPTARLCLAGLPNLWRFLQCLRRYRDSRDVVNLANAGKYSSGLVVVLFAGLSKGLDPSNMFGWTAFRILLVVFSVIATAYTSFWDLKMDFGFFQKDSKHRFLRNELLYSPKLKYYLIMPVDVLLRLTWIFTIAPEPFGITISSDLFLFCLAIGEVTRRFLWNFFRMENESAGNCGKFRAVTDLPLPYGDEMQDGNEEEENRRLLNEPADAIKKFLNQFDSDDEKNSHDGSAADGHSEDEESLMGSVSSEPKLKHGSDQRVRFAPSKSVSSSPPPSPSSSSSASSTDEEPAWRASAKASAPAINILGPCKTDEDLSSSSSMMAMRGGDVSSSSADDEDDSDGAEAASSKSTDTPSESVNEEENAEVIRISI